MKYTQNPFILVDQELVRNLARGAMGLLVGDPSRSVVRSGESEEHAVRTARWQLVVPTGLVHSPGAACVVFAEGSMLHLRNAAGGIVRVDFAMAAETPDELPKNQYCSGLTRQLPTKSTILLVMHVVVVEACKRHFEPSIADVLHDMEYILHHELVHALDPGLMHGRGTQIRTSSSADEARARLTSEFRDAAPAVTVPVTFIDPKTDRLRSRSWGDRDDGASAYFTSDRETRAFGAELASETLLHRSKLASPGDESIGASVEAAAIECVDTVVRSWWMRCTPKQRQRFLRDVTALVDRELGDGGW